MTPTKQTLESSTSVGESAASRVSRASKQDLARLRADAVSLEVPVKAHGSRVTDTTIGATPHTEPFEEKTSTLIVFPLGGVLKMSTSVAVGQMMVLTNLRTGHDAICRVVKVRAFAQDQKYVEIEFTNRQPGYWGVYFPSEGAEVPAPLEAKAEKAEEKPAAYVAKPVSPAPKLQLPIAKPTTAKSSPSPFAPLGSKEEDVQPAAAATSPISTKTIAPADGRGLGFKADATTLTAEPVPVAPAPLAPATPEGEPLRRPYAAPRTPLADVGAIAEPLPAAETERFEPSGESAPFGSYAPSASLGGGTAAREPFGSSLSGAAYGSDVQAFEPSRGKSFNFVAVAAGIVAVLVAGTAAAYFLRMPPFDIEPATTAGVVAPAPTAAPTGTAAQPSSVSESDSVTPAPAGDVSPASAPPLASLTRPAPSTPHVVESPLASSVSAPVKPSKAAQPTSSAPSAPTDQKRATAVPNMIGSLSAHPVARAHSARAQQTMGAPAIDASTSLDSGTGELPTISAGPRVVPPPLEAAPEEPVRIRVGGAIKPPRLIASVVPNYPSIAREAGVEGDVVIDTTIDTNGSVTAMKVISGPPMLRQAALDSLRQWHYEPSKLNGEPVPVQMKVTIKFHRQ